MDQKIQIDYIFLLDCLKEVLEEIGQKDLIPFLPFDLNISPNKKQKEQTKKISELISLCFQLLNMVEENAAAQFRRKQEKEDGFTALSGLWGQSLSKAKEYGFTHKEILPILKEIICEPVLTAHPTEAKRASVLEIHRDLYLLLVKKENKIWTDLEQNTIREEIKVQLERLWRTGEILLHKPDIRSERRNIEYYLRNVFPNVLHELDQRFFHAWEQSGGHLDDVSDPKLIPTIRFGNWIGGDRDGHPFVTNEITKETLTLFSQYAREIHKNKFIELTKFLSLSDRIQSPPIEFLDRLELWHEEHKSISPEVKNRNPNEPWRQYCSFLIEKIDNQISIQEYSEHLLFLRESLIAIGAKKIAKHYVFPMERLAVSIGFHLAKTDIRQNSVYHAIAIEQILKTSGKEEWNYREWTEEKKIQWILDELKTQRPFLLQDSDPGKEASNILSTFRSIKQFISEFGTSGIGSFIVSMTQSLSDLLLVYLFLKETNLLEYNEDKGFLSPFQVVPLFETIEDLERSPDILEAYLKQKIVRNSFVNQSIQIMLGYSDSNKDGGIFASQWNLYATEIKLTEIAKRHHFKLKFFHGRGGSISRGGGKTHKFLDALPHGTLDGEIRVTVQGESISQQYANKITAIYNLELFLATTTKVTLRHQRNQKKNHPAYPILESLSHQTKDTYTDLLNTEGFLTFFSQATPIDAIENSKIGSRPSRRTGKRTFNDLRAIPWVFSWSQSRFHLPNWYGVGSVLYDLSQNKKEKFQILKEEINEWHFLNYLIKNIETGIYSASPKIYTMYSELVEDTTIKNKILTKIDVEYKKTMDVLYNLRGKEIGEVRPSLIETLKLREPGLCILHEKQIDLLSEWRKNQNEFLLEELLVTVNAIASGLRTTG